MPTFYSLAGEESVIPESLLALVRAATPGVNCSGCSHMHYLGTLRPLGRPKLNDSVKPKIADGEISETLAS